MKLNRRFQLWGRWQRLSRKYIAEFHYIYIFLSVAITNFIKGKEVCSLIWRFLYQEGVENKFTFLGVEVSCGLYIMQSLSRATIVFFSRKSLHMLRTELICLTDRCVAGCLYVCVFLFSLALVFQLFISCSCVTFFLSPSTYSPLGTPTKKLTRNVKSWRIFSKLQNFFHIYLIIPVWEIS